MNKGKSVKKLILTGALLLALLVAADGLLLAGRYVLISGSVYHKKTEQLDLRGRSLPGPENLALLENLKTLDLRGLNVTLQEKNAIQALLPDCLIKWDIQVGNHCYDPSLEEIQVSSLNGEDINALEQFENLQLVDARSCRDYQALAQLVSRKPELWVIYQVELAGQTWGQNSLHLTLQNAEAEELEARLPALPHAETVYLTGTLPEIDQLEALQEGFPDIRFSWDSSVDGKTYRSTDEKLELSEQWFRSPEKLKELLRYFPGTRKIKFQGNIPARKQRSALHEAFPELTFYWDYPIGGNSYSMDLTELDLSGTQGLSLEQLEQIMGNFPDLQKLTVCGCGFSNEELDALNQKYEHIRIVWDVVISGLSIPTDSLYFYPFEMKISVEDQDLEPLRYCTDMICIDLGHNTQITSCEWAGNMKNLTYLVLADTGISDLTPLKGLDHLKFLEIFLTPVTDYTPLLECRGLEDLNLGLTKGDPEPLKQMSWLKRLWWTGNPEALEKLADELPDTEKVNCPQSSTGWGWRLGHLYCEMRDLMGVNKLQN